MEIRVKIPDELASQAQAQGVPVETYVERILAREAAEQANGRLLTSEQIRPWLDSLAQFSEKIPTLPETISREWIYQDHD